MFRYIYFLIVSVFFIHASANGSNYLAPKHLDFHLFQKELFFFYDILEFIKNHDKHDFKNSANIASSLKEYLTSIHHPVDNFEVLPLPEYESIDQGWEFWDFSYLGQRFEIRYHRNTNRLRISKGIFEFLLGKIIQTSNDPRQIEQTMIHILTIFQQAGLKTIQPEKDFKFRQATQREQRKIALVNKLYPEAQFQFYPISLLGENIVMLFSFINSELGLLRLDPEEYYPDIEHVSSREWKTASIQKYEQNDRLFHQILGVSDTPMVPMEEISQLISAEVGRPIKVYMKYEPEMGLTSEMKAKIHQKLGSQKVIQGSIKEKILRIAKIYGAETEIEQLDKSATLSDAMIIILEKLLSAFKVRLAPAAVDKITESFNNDRSNQINQIQFLAASTGNHAISTFIIMTLIELSDYFDTQFDGKTLKTVLLVSKDIREEKLKHILALQDVTDLLNELITPKNSAKSPEKNRLQLEINHGPEKTSFRGYQDGYQLALKMEQEIKENQPQIAIIHLTHEGNEEILAYGAGAVETRRQLGNQRIGKIIPAGSGGNARGHIEHDEALKEVEEANPNFTMVLSRDTMPSIMHSVRSGVPVVTMDYRYENFIDSDGSGVYRVEQLAYRALRRARVSNLKAHTVLLGPSLMIRNLANFIKAGFPNPRAEVASLEPLVYAYEMDSIIDWIIENQIDEVVLWATGNRINEARFQELAFGDAYQTNPEPRALMGPAIYDEKTALQNTERLYGNFKKSTEISA